MKRFLILAPLALLMTVPHAQQTKKRVGMVNLQQVVKAMPGSKSYIDATASADKDLIARQKTIQTLLVKANSSRKPADIQALNTAQTAYTKAQANHQQTLAKAFQPLAVKINAAVAKVAKANSYSIVFDQRVAAQSKVIVYADASTNITNAVIKAIK